MELREIEGGAAKPRGETFPRPLGVQGDNSRRCFAKAKHLHQIKKAGNSTCFFYLVEIVGFEPATF